MSNKASVTHITREGSKKRVTEARLALQREITLVRDLTFLKTHVRLTPKQLATLDEAILRATDVVTYYSEQYIRAATELVASITK